MPSPIRQIIRDLNQVTAWGAATLADLRKLRKAEGRAIRRARYGMVWEADQALRGQAAKPARSVCGAQTRSGAPCQAPTVCGGSRCRRHANEVPSGFSSVPGRSSPLASRAS
jgi:hypothetical protein